MAEKSRNLGIRSTPEKQKKLKQWALDHGTTLQGIFDRLTDGLFEPAGSPTKINLNPVTKPLQEKGHPDNISAEKRESGEESIGEALRDAEAEVTLEKIYVLNVTGFRDITETLRQVLAVLNTVAGSIIRLEASIGQLGNLVRQPKAVSIRRNKKTTGKPKKRAG